VYQLYSRASAKTVPADLGLTGSLEFHRRELVRQRDMVESVWSWYLAPFVPGLLVFIKGVFPKHGPGFVLALAFHALVFGGIWWLNRRGARRLTRQIAELDNLGSQQ
jgi:Flp pilus assembly protein TadB